MIPTVSPLLQTLATKPAPAGGGDGAAFASALTELGAAPFMPLDPEAPSPIHGAVRQAVAVPGKPLPASPAAQKLEDPLSWLEADPIGALATPVPAQVGSGPAPATASFFPADPAAQEVRPASMPIQARTIAPADMFEGVSPLPDREPTISAGQPLAVSDEEASDADDSSDLIVPWVQESFPPLASTPVPLPTVAAVTQHGAMPLSEDETSAPAPAMAETASALPALRPDLAAGEVADVDMLPTPADELPVAARPAPSPDLTGVRSFGRATADGGAPGLDSVPAGVTPPGLGSPDIASVRPADPTLPSTIQTPVGVGVASTVTHGSFVAKQSLASPSMEHTAVKLSASEPVAEEVAGPVGPAEPRPEKRAGEPIAAPGAPARLAPKPVAPAVTTAGPAARLFAAELHRAARDTRRPVAGDAQPGVLALDGLRPAGSIALDSVAAPLDFRQEQWPAIMVERIERLRDAADAADTRIRLVPDALGAIDVSVTQEGETVHVHFTAEQAATRAALQEAAPRLAEAAEARGLKLGQTFADGGAAERGPRQQAPDQSRSPAPRPARAAELGPDLTDNRIA